jgi:hypothetical protein
MSDCGQNFLCPEIRESIVNDSGKLQALQKQQASTRNSAAIAEEIQSLEQGIASLRQRAQELRCFC